jgi:hypothetical protein
MLEINGKWITQQGLLFTDIVDKISNHAHCLNEWETKNDIHGNLGACCNKEGGSVVVLSRIRKMDIKPNVEFGGDGPRVQACDNSRGNDGCVIIE